MLGLFFLVSDQTYDKNFGDHACVVGRHMTVPATDLIAVEIAQLISNNPIVRVIQAWQIISHS